MIELGVNIDHVATIRNARGGRHRDHRGPLRPPRDPLSPLDRRRGASRRGRVQSPSFDLSVRRANPDPRGRIMMRYRATRPWVALLVALGALAAGHIGLQPVFLSVSVLAALALVFVAGLMVGRTPEYLGKRIGSKEVTLAILAILVSALGTLGLAAVACVARAGLERMPEDEKLLLQLALLQDLRHDARGARETLLPIEQRARPREPETARHRYNALPLERLGLLRDEVDASAATHLADLAAALGGAAP